MKKQTYIRCPRCELNYILKKDKYCNVCKLEMKALGTLGVEENLDLELCPICKVNYINSDEDMCSACKKERDDLEDDETSSDKHKDVWSPFEVNDEDDALLPDEETGDMVSITNLEDAPIETDDDIDIAATDEEEEVSEEDESFDNLDDDDEAFDNIDYDDEDCEEDIDDNESEAPNKKSSKKK